MKKFFLLLTTAIVTFTSCNTKEKVVYFQDIQNAEVFQAQMVENLTELGQKACLYAISQKGYDNQKYKCYIYLFNITNFITVTYYCIISSEA